MEAVTNGYNSGYGNLPGLLNYNELLNGVVNNKPQMGVSIKILHRFCPKDMIKNAFTGRRAALNVTSGISKLDIVIVTQPPGEVNKNVYV
jgi:hypothetical protein